LTFLPLRKAECSLKTGDSNWKLFSSQMENAMKCVAPGGPLELKLHFKRFLVRAHPEMTNLSDFGVARKI
jgi:hypothetical protein